MLEILKTYTTVELKRIISRYNKTLETIKGYSKLKKDALLTLMTKTENINKFKSVKAKVKTTPTPATPAPFKPTPAPRPVKPTPTPAPRPVKPTPIPAPRPAKPTTKATPLKEEKTKEKQPKTKGKTPTKATPAGKINKFDIMREERGRQTADGKMPLDDYNILVEIIYVDNLKPELVQNMFNLAYNYAVENVKQYNKFNKLSIKKVNPYNFNNKSKYKEFKNFNTFDRVNLIEDIISNLEGFQDYIKSNKHNLAMDSFYTYLIPFKFTDTVNRFKKNVLFKKYSKSNLDKILYLLRNAGESVALPDVKGFEDIFKLTTVKSEKPNIELVYNYIKGVILDENKISREGKNSIPTLVDIVKNENKDIDKYLALDNKKLKEKIEEDETPKPTPKATPLKKEKQQKKQPKTR